MKITITEIARLASVSKSSVSLVLNNRPGVSQKTRAKVLAIIKKYHYHPDQIARSLAGGETKSIGLVVKEIDNPYFSRLERGVYEACSRQGYTVLLGSSEQSLEKEREIIRTMVSKRVDGLVISPLQSEESDYSYLSDLLTDNFPLVVLGDLANYATNIVDIDNYQAAYDAVAYLLKQGHVDIAHLAGPSRHGQERAEGYKQALLDNNIQFQRSRVVNLRPTVLDGYRAGREIFGSGKPQPTAVFCYNDLLAIGVMNALHESGIAVPESVSVMGFDNIDVCEHLRIPLTTVEMPAYDIGQSAANLLVRQMKAGTTPRLERIFLDHRIVERKSVAKRGVPASLGTFAAS